MRKIIVHLVTGGLMAAYALGTPLATRAEDPAPKPKAAARSSKSTQFKGTVKSVDKTALTITVTGKKDERVFRMTSKTRLYKESKPATFDAVAVGDSVTVRAKSTADGQWDATSIRIATNGGNETTPKRDKPVKPPEPDQK